MLESSISVEGWVQATGEDGFSDSPGHFVGVFVKVGDVLEPEVVARGFGVLADGGGKDVRVRLFGSVVVLFESDFHGSASFTYVRGCASVIEASSAWGMVDHFGF